MLGIFIYNCRGAHARRRLPCVKGAVKTDGFDSVFVIYKLKLNIKFPFIIIARHYNKNIQSTSNRIIFIRFYSRSSVNPYAKTKNQTVGADVCPPQRLPGVKRAVKTDGFDSVFVIDKLKLNIKFPFIIIARHYKINAHAIYCVYIFCFYIFIPTYQKCTPFCVNFYK